MRQNTTNMALNLDQTDPLVISAKNAEEALFAFYNLKSTDHKIFLNKFGINIRVSVFGNGEPLIIVPGNTGDVFPLASLLAEIKNRRIIAINRPGGGLSEGIDHTSVDVRKLAVETISKTMDYFQISCADFVSHSMGAHWTLWLAMDEPQKVKSMTLLGNPGNVLKGKPPIAIKFMSMWPFNKIMFKILAGSSKDTNPKTLKFMGSTKDTIKMLPPELGRAYYYFRLLPHYLISFTTLLKNAPKAIDTSQLSSIRQKTQLLLGDKDTFASTRVGESIANAMPSCSLHIIKEASHLPWLEKPEECGMLVNEFLKD